MDFIIVFFSFLLICIFSVIDGRIIMNINELTLDVCVNDAVVVIDN